MTAQSQRSDDSTNEQSTPRPSQAEESRTLGSDDGDQELIPSPSQAEGDRATIDEDLDRKNKQ